VKWWHGMTDATDVWGFCTASLLTLVFVGTLIGWALSTPEPSEYYLEEGKICQLVLGAVDPCTPVNGLSTEQAVSIVERLNAQRRECLK
jgi:hypothetical protein